MNSTYNKQDSKKPLLVIVTGLSGAGRSVSIDALEDIGFYCIDNLPIELIESVINFLSANTTFDNYAIGLDLRNQNSIALFPQIKTKLQHKVRVDLIFLTADEQVILQRYSTTRRKHPLLDKGGELIPAIRREKYYLSSLEQLADVCFDTSTWSPHTLSRQIENRYVTGDLKRNLFVTIISFGFKNGQYRPAESIFDVRFLDNPYFKEELKHKTGLDEEVKKFVFSDPRAVEFLEKLVDIHKFLLPNYYQEGKHYFRIAIGCTGGQHRSVSFAEVLAQKLVELNLQNIIISVSHRDINVSTIFED